MTTLTTSIQQLKNDLLEIFKGTSTPVENYSKEWLTSNDSMDDSQWALFLVNSNPDERRQHLQLLLTRRKMKI